MHFECLFDNPYLMELVSQPLKLHSIHVDWEQQYLNQRLT